MVNTVQNTKIKIGWNQKCGAKIRSLKSFNINHEIHLEIDTKPGNK